MDSFIGRYYILFYIQFTYTINEHSESKGLDEIKTKMAIQDDFCLTSSTFLTIIAISVLCMYLFVVNLKSHVKIDEISTMKIVLILVILFLFLLVSSLVEEGTEGVLIGSLFSPEHAKRKTRGKARKLKRNCFFINRLLEKELY